MTSSATRETEPAGLEEYLDRARRRVEEALAGYLPEVDEAPSATCPARLAMAMRHSLLGGGKRLRPRLCLMAAEACRGTA
ncbi:MAG: polyprenyl synthetase family protein, partial [Isosphaeraceae bacterium]